MPSLSPNGDGDHATFHPTLTAFLEYTHSADITFHSAIQLKELPGRGIGVVAAADVKPETELMWVPTSALLRPSCVPESFIPLSRRSLYGAEGEGPRMRTHALLAAWIAFGECGEHEAWMATWPSLQDMQVGMPLCWPEAAKGLRVAGGKEGGRDFAVLPWDVSGRFATVPSLSNGGISTRNGMKRRSTRDGMQLPSAGLLAKQQAKFDLDIRSVQETLSHISDALDNPSSQQYSLFLHAWLIVNSRCFYYIPPGCRVPEDSDEAMTLCPAVDIFNHNDGDGGGCEVSHDEDGFTVGLSCERALGYTKGEELFVSYGSHANDLLWVEYGFLLDQNKWDSITIPDQVVLDGLSQAERDLLEMKGYLGGYSINCDGICWRTEVVAWLGTATQEQWEDLVNGLWYPDESKDETPEEGASGVDVVIYQETPKRRASRKIASWLIQIREEVGNSLRGLLSMNKAEILVVFGDDKDVARQRYDLTLKRWKQIWSACNNAMSCVELDCPGSFVIPTQAGRENEDLSLEVEQFIDMLRVDANEKHLPG